MKQTTRNGVFETNSSSVHALAICSECQSVEELDASTYEAEIDADGEFGWGLEYLTTPDEKLQYLYTLVANMSHKGDMTMINRLKKKFPCVAFKEYKNFDYPDYSGYVDHANEKLEIFQEAMRHPNAFLNNAVIILTNDNSNFEETLDKWCKKHNAQLVASGGN